MDSDKQIPKNKNYCCAEFNLDISNEIPVKSIHIQILVILPDVYEHTTF
jgi:hypothetical protein